MSLAEPLVSVTIITYNHEKYIGQAIQSVLAQSYRDLELVVVNDGSTDRTAEIINSFSDPRMRVFHQENRGPSLTANRALAECRGRYLAVMAGDDMLPPDRVEKQLTEYLKGGSRVLFSQFDMIDEDGAPTDTDWYDSNRTPAYGRAKVLRRLFEGSAPAMILTLFTETRIIREEHQYCDPALYQLHDYDLQIRLAKKYEFHYLNDSLYHFRVRRGHLNLSGSDPFKLIRTHNEFYLLMRHFFDDVSIDLFKEIFPDLVRNRDFSTPLEYLCEQGFVWLKSPNPCLRLLGVEKLYDLLQQDEGRTLLARHYNFTHKQFANITKLLDVQRLYPDQTSLYIDTGAGFDTAEPLKTPTNHTLEDFSLTFDLSEAGPVRGVHWVPMEGRYCRVQLCDISYWDANGKVTHLDRERITSNGLVTSDGIHQFLTISPTFFLPIEGEVAGLALRGRWWSPLGGRGERFRQTTLYPDDGKNFREEIAVRRAACLETEEFSLTFNLPELGTLRAIRWDPVEDCLCKVRLESVIYHDASGAVHTLDPAQIASNGTVLMSGEHLFDTTDPMFFLPATGAVRAVIVRGRWEGPLTPAEVERQKARDRGARRRSSPWVRRILKGGVRRLTSPFRGVK